MEKAPSTGLSDEEMILEAMNIVDKAADKGLILRLLGAMGIVVSCLSISKAYMNTYKNLGRLGANAMFTDIDFAAYSKQRKNLEKFFRDELRFAPNMAINALFGNERLIFYNTWKKYSVDVFFDKLKFCHDIIFGDSPGRGRLELFKYHIPPEDLLLEKLQIHDITYKDISDIAMLLLAHRISSNSTCQGHINGSYVAKILADDWGFWYDSMNNLKTVEKYVKKFVEEEKFTDDQAATVLNNLKIMVGLIETTPKTDRWNKRAKDGTRKLWYRKVSELEKR
ncbi:MAG: hypothetical protein ACUVUF_07545 [Candidatus Bathycorpusculaceae bacterium]